MKVSGHSALSLAEGAENTSMAARLGCQADCHAAKAEELPAELSLELHGTLRCGADVFRRPFHDWNVGFRTSATPCNVQQEQPASASPPEALVVVRPCSVRWAWQGLSARCACGLRHTTGSQHCINMESIILTSRRN